MPTVAINFTKPVLANLPIPAKQVYYRDTKEKGLVLDVRPSGNKSFYLYKRIKNKPEKIHIGTFPDITIENARKMASVLKGQIAQGFNPQDEKRSIRAEKTFGEFFQLYLNNYSKKRKKSWKYDEREVNKYLFHWFDRKLSAVTKAEIRDLH